MLRDDMRALNEVEQSIVRQYTSSNPSNIFPFGGAAYELNNKLRCGQVLTPEQVEFKIALFNLIKYPLSEDMTVYRAVANNDELQQICPGSSFSYPAFMSTSSSPNHIFTHLKTHETTKPIGCICTVSVPEGVPALIIGGNEHEILFRPGHKIEVIDICDGDLANNQLINPVARKEFSELWEVKLKILE